MFKTFRLCLATHDHAAVVFVDWSRGDDEIDGFSKILLMENHGGFANVAIFPNAFAVDKFGGLIPEGCPTGFSIIEAVADDAMFGGRKSCADRALRCACDGWEDRHELSEAKIRLRFQDRILLRNVVSERRALYDK